MKLNVLCEYLRTIPGVYDAFSYEKTDVIIVCFDDSSTIVFTHASDSGTAADLYFPTMRSTALYDWREHTTVVHPYYIKGQTNYDKSIFGYHYVMSSAIDSLFDGKLRNINKTIPAVTAAYALYHGKDTLTMEEKGS